MNKKVRKILSFMVYSLIFTSMFMALMPMREAQASTPVLDRSDIIVIGDKNDGIAGDGFSGDPVIFRMDKDGNMIWQKQLPFNKIALGSSQWIADRNLAEDSFYMIPGYVKFPENLIDGKTRILKFDANGNLLWDIPFSLDTEEISANPVDGGAYVSDSKLGVYKIDTDGNVIWGPKTFDYGNFYFVSVSTDVTTGGVYVVIGGNSVSNYDNNMVIKADKDGNVLWRKTIKGAINRINSNPIDGGVYVGAEAYARHTYKLDANGNINWVKYNFPSPYTSPRGVSPVDGAIYVSGGFLWAKAAMDGTILWSVNNAYNGFAWATYSIAPAIDSDYVYTGDGYWLNLGISKFKGSDGSQAGLVWHKDPGFYSYGCNYDCNRYGPQYLVYTGTPSKVSNNIPIVDSGSDQTVNEGDTVSFSGSFTDADPTDTHTISWDFGDDATATGTLAPTHVYADNGIYTVKLTVTDNSGGTGTDILQVTINNLPPVVDAGGDQTVNEGDTISLAPATFSDLGTSDTHTATINWGDGTALEIGSVTESEGRGTLSGSHSYAKYGLYTVEVCAEDDDGASSCDTFGLTVKDITPPVITINGANPLTAVLGTPYEDAGATATDNSDGTVPVATTGTVDTTTVGTYTITYTATDSSRNTATATRTVNIIYAPTGSTCLGKPGHEILQPINTDGSSIFKKGSTVPAKFRVCDSNGNSIGTSGVVSSFKLTKKVYGTVADIVNEDVTSTTPDTAFRWDTTDQQWIFNINTKNLLASYTYTYRISLNDGTYIDFTLGLK